MFEELLSALSPDSRGGILIAWDSPSLMAQPGYRHLLRACPDGTLQMGMYRLHDAVTGPWAAQWMAAVAADTSRVVPFAYDWLGRQFALDVDSAGRRDAVVLCDPFGGRVRLDVSFDEFHHRFLPDNLESVLHPAMFQRWTSEGGVHLPLEREQCAVFKLSPLLGGAFEPENLRLGTLPEQRASSLFRYSDGRRPGERHERIVSDFLLSGRQAEALHHEDPFVRAHTITYWSPPIPVSALVEALGDESAAVRDAAAMGFVDVAPTAETCAALQDALSDEDEDVRWSADFALQQQRGDLLQRLVDAVAALRSLGDADSRVGGEPEAG